MKEIDSLSPAQRRVVFEVRRGLSNRQIADKLMLSPFTVKSHLSRAYAVLEVHTRAELIALIGSKDRVATTLDVIATVEAIKAEKEKKLPNFGTKEYYIQEGWLEAMNLLLERLVEQVD